MNKVSKSRGRKKAVAKLLYCDSFGVPFAEANRVALSIPFSMKDIKRPEVLKWCHEQAEAHYSDPDTGVRFAYGKCWICEYAYRLEAHHCVSRWDFVGNICMCCRDCHKDVQHNPERLKDVLRAMWKNNKLALSWLHLIKARGSYFPFTYLD